MPVPPHPPRTGKPLGWPAGARAESARGPGPGRTVENNRGPGGARNGECWGPLGEHRAGTKLSTNVNHCLSIASPSLTLGYPLPRGLAAFFPGPVLGKVKSVVCDSGEGSAPVPGSSANPRTPLTRLSGRSWGPVVTEDREGDSYSQGHRSPPPASLPGGRQVQAGEEPQAFPTHTLRISQTSRPREGHILGPVAPGSARPALPVPHQHLR